MANFASKEGTLGAGVAQLFNFKALLGVNATSLTYSNDSASSTHQLSIDGFTFTVKPSESRVISGVENWEVLTIGGDGGSTGPYRCYATSSVVPATINKPYGGPITTAGLADDSVTDAKLAVGAHVTAVAGSPFPCQVIVVDVANANDGAGAGQDLTGLVGKHELLHAFATFAAPAAGTKLEIQTAGGAATVATLTAGAVLAGTTVFATPIDTTAATFASGATIRVKRTQGGASTLSRLVLVFMKVA